MDRRIMKSRQAIMEAFVALLGEKGFDKVTINDIAERANVNRGTVYLHFTDKFDLQEQCIETYLQQLIESCQPAGEMTPGSARELLLQTFEFLEAHAPIYSILITGKGNPVFRERMMVFMRQGITDYLSTNGIPSGISREVEVQFLASGAVSLMEWWIEEGMPYSPTEMVDQLFALLLRHFQMPEGEKEKGSKGKVSEEFARG
ncbi:TetR/AcrR family transcriptional regulator [Paenibacillus sp. FSL R7-0216]|uniref:TetR/AcrR family transcriptional regulator n=1 Tax=Paenibacillus sp. FSL R7-0216 TaxID=2921677 RepID=UPI0030D79BF3